MLMSPTHRAQVLTFRTQELEPKGNMGHRIDREETQCCHRNGEREIILSVQEIRALRILLQKT